MKQDGTGEEKTPASGCIGFLLVLTMRQGGFPLGVTLNLNRMLGGSFGFTCCLMFMIQ